MISPFPSMLSHFFIHYIRTMMNITFRGGLSGGLLRLFITLECFVEFWWKFHCHQISLETWWNQNNSAVVLLLHAYINDSIRKSLKILWLEIMGAIDCRCVDLPLLKIVKINNTLIEKWNTTIEQTEFS